MGREKERAECRDCEGSGEIAFEFESGSNAEIMAMSCPSCQGSGKVEQKIRDQQEGLNEIWCECSELENSRYYRHGEHESMVAAHWRCNACNKVIHLG